MKHWYVARVEKFEADKIWVRYDGWAESDNEWITRTDAPTRIAPFFTVCSAAKRRVGGLSFDLSAALALKVNFSLLSNTIWLADELDSLTQVISMLCR